MQSGKASLPNSRQTKALSLTHSQSVALVSQGLPMAGISSVFQCHCTWVLLREGCSVLSTLSGTTVLAVSCSVTITSKCSGLPKKKKLRIKRPSEGRTQRVFWAVKLFLYDSVLVDTCHYILVKTHRMYNTKSEPEGKLWTSGDSDVSV